jgi:hypothetical protein
LFIFQLVPIQRSPKDTIASSPSPAAELST